MSEFGGPWADGAIPALVACRAAVAEGLVALEDYLAAQPDASPALHRIHGQLTAIRAELEAHGPETAEA